MDSIGLFTSYVGVEMCINYHERRSQFGIHPDGKPLGTTAGCIGLTDADTKPIFEELKKLIEQEGEIFIEVI
ncbi:MAG: hypothetical protein U1F42_10825 [Candidatus Competibacteraceae bacterium]